MIAHEISKDCVQDDKFSKFRVSRLRQQQNDSFTMDGEKKSAKNV